MKTNKPSQEERLGELKKLYSEIRKVSDVIYGKGVLPFKMPKFTKTNKDKELYIDNVRFGDGKNSSLGMVYCELHHKKEGLQYSATLVHVLTTGMGVIEQMEYHKEWLYGMLNWDSLVIDFYRGWRSPTREYDEKQIKP